MIIISFKEALFGIFGLFFVGIAIRQINLSIRKYADEGPRETRAIINGFERVSRNWLLVKVLKTQEVEYRKFVRSIDNVFRSNLLTAGLANVASAAAPFFGILLLTLIVYCSQTFFMTSGAKLLSFLYIFIRFVKL